MKTTALLILTCLSLFAFTNKPGIVWSKTAYDFGTVKRGDTLNTSFTYYNHSDTSFIIENIQASCGCVVPNWTKKPLHKGDSAVLQVAFDTHGKSGKHEKTKTIYSTHGLYELILKAEIHK